MYIHACSHHSHQDKNGALQRYNLLTLCFVLWSHIFYIFIIFAANSQKSSCCCCYENISLLFVYMFTMSDALHFFLVV